MKKVTFCALLFAPALFAQTILTPFEPNIGFTTFTKALDAYANEIVVSANYGHDITQSRIFVFQKNGPTVFQETYFTPSDVAVNDDFGGSVSIDNDFIAAGSKANDQVAADAGAVYMYRKVANNWVFFQKITAFDGVAEDYFGREVKVMGNQLFVSSPNNEPSGQPTSTNSGAIYIYNFNGTSWVFSQKITPGVSANPDTSLIKVSGNKMVIASGAGLTTYNYDGALWNFSNSFTPASTVIDFRLDNNQLFVLQAGWWSSIDGSQHQDMNIYDSDGSGNWSLNTTLHELNLYDKFASNFVVRNDLMFVSLNSHSLLYTAKTPTSIYRKINGVWTFLEYVYGQGQSDRDDYFGARMAITDDIVVIGAPIEFRPSAYGGRAYTVDVTLGVNDNPLNNINAYPNPTTGVVNLNGITDEIKLIDIYQIDGKLLKSIQSNFESISLSDFQNGVYLLKFTMDNGASATRKIVKI